MCGVLVLKFIVLLFIGCVSGQVQQELFKKLVCIEHEECGACLSAASHCRWCADPYFRSGIPRCNDDESLVTNGCSQGLIQRPAKPIWEVAENRSLQDVINPESIDAVVQIQPQKIKLSLKQRETKKIEFKYRPAKNYPLDLYYLMDLTWSMKDDKETLVSLRDDLPVMLKNLTDNFKLGFGSFAEKPLMPFISVDTRRLANPCAVEEGTCNPTYSYRHHLSLTNQVNNFIKNVNDSDVTANLDNAEAQLDALVQAITCVNQVGWSEHSRKIVILLSDGYLHTAGDGKLAGAILKNNGECHLDENGYYSAATVYDYPSISQVYTLLDDFKVNVIFAVTENVKDHYDSIHELMKDFTYVAKLESDSSNILKLVKMGYEDIVSVVDFEDDSKDGPVQVKYFTDCGIPGGSMVEATRCSGIEYGMTLNYEAHLSLQSCPEFKKTQQTIRVSESQLGQDSLTLQVEVQCGCECEGDQLKDMALTCPVNSHLVCGVCQCNKGWSGPQCDCSTKNVEVSLALLSKCYEPNVTDSKLCSGAGDCMCGKCDCDRGYNGKFCQCKSCEISRENGIECGGVGRGDCACGQCACAEGWSGAACDCTAANETCKAPGDKQLCSGNGDCICGQCQCSITNGTSYSGRYCETCATCENPLCITAEPCVSCYLNSECTSICRIGNNNYTVTEAMNISGSIKDEDIKCIFRRYENNFECEYTYTYNTGEQEMVVMEIVIRSKECVTPKSAAILTSGLIIIGCILALGIIAIMAVKTSQIVADRRAYAKFAKEAQESRNQTQELNPLYISPISEFKLPDAFPRDKND